MAKSRQGGRKRYSPKANEQQPSQSNGLEAWVPNAEKLFSTKRNDSINGQQSNNPFLAGLFPQEDFPVFLMDGFTNPLARLGDGSTNITEATDYVMSRITRNYNLMTTLYRTHPIVKHIIDVIPEDMVKNWYRINSQLDLTNKRKLTRLERSTKIRSKILEGMKWGRLYGGAAGVIVIDGHDDILDEPLALDMVMPDSFKGLIILDRWSGIFPGVETVDDYNDPDFGLPEYYTINSDEIGGNGIRVHHSRIVRFVGRHLPYIERIAEQYWGASDLEHVFDVIKKYDNTGYNIASLVFRANLNVYKMKGMEQIAVMPEMAQRDLHKTLAALNVMMNNQGMQVIGPSDEMMQLQYTFSGLPDVYEMFMLDVAGAVKIPATKLFGRSPAGMNATGESDMQNYYDSIEEEQEGRLRPIMDVLLPIMCMSAFGAIPDDLDYDFVNVRRPSESEKKSLAAQVSQAVASAYGAGIISQQIAMQELKNSTEITGMWQSISDDDIEKADSTLDGSGYMPMPPAILAPTAPDEPPEDSEDGSRIKNMIHQIYNKARGR